MRMRWVLVVSLLLAPMRASAESDQDRAKLLFDKATAAYALADYAEAARYYEEAFAVKPLPALLFDAAQAHRKAGHKERAILLYRNYLDFYGAKVSTENRDEIERIVDGLRLSLPVPAVVAPPAATDRTAPIDPPAAIASAPIATLLTSPPAPRKPLVKRAWFWGMIAGSAAAVGVAVGLGVGLGRASRDPQAPLGTLKVN